MCGILGVFGKSAQKYKKIFNSCSEVLSHRGPDGHGVWISKNQNCFLLHNRLAILDLSEKANQPMVSCKGVISYNGEIYNHLTLRKKKKYSSNSDTETLLSLIDDNDIKFVLPKLNGMFAVAYYNKKKDELTLFRDTLGIKPMYYKVLRDKTIIFSSEIKGILPFISKKKFLDLDTLATYLLYENWGKSHSLFNGIKSLNPGEILNSKGNEIDSQVISLFKTKSKLNKNTNFSTKVRKIVSDSVNSHLISDVPIATYLSGGIDSSIITLLASKKKKNIISYNGYFDCNENWYDESSYAELIADKAKIELIKVKITPNDFLESFDKLIFHLDEPRMGMGSFSQFIVAKEVKKRRKVILSGHGGDELFAGYPLFKFFYFIENILSTSSLKILFSLNKNEFTWFFYSLNKLFTTGKLHFAPKIGELFLKKIKLKNYEFKFSTKLFNSPINELFNYYQKTYIPGLLTVEDKISMAHSIETRTPLWSQEVVNQIIRIPINEKLKYGNLKFLLKKSFSELLGKEIIDAPKRGFPTPLRHWFRNELRDEVEKRLLNSTSDVYKIFSKDKIRKLLKSHNDGFKSYYGIDEKRAHLIWMLLCLESWMIQFNVNWPKNSFKN